MATFNMRNVDPEALKHFKKVAGRYMRIRENEPDLNIAFESEDIDKTNLDSRVRIAGMVRNMDERTYQEFYQTTKLMVQSLEAALQSASSATDKAKYQRQLNEYISTLNLLDLFHNLYAELNENLAAANKAAEGVKYARESLSFSVREGNKEGIDRASTLLVSSVSSYKEAVKKAQDANAVHAGLTGTRFKMEITPVLMDKNSKELFELYYTIGKSIRERQLALESEKDESKRAKLAAEIASLNISVGALPALLDNPHDFATIREVVDTNLNREYPSKEERARKEHEEALTSFRNKMNQEFARLYEYLQQKFKTPNWKFDVFEQKAHQISRMVEDSFPELTIDEKLAYYQQCYSEISKRVAADYKDFAPIMGTVQNLMRDIDKLKTLTYGTPEFTTQYQSIMSKVSDLQKSNLLHIAYDENTSELNISFEHKMINGIKQTVLTPEQMKQMASARDASMEEEKKRKAEEKLEQARRAAEAMGRGKPSESGPTAGLGGGAPSAAAAATGAVSAEEEKRDIEFYIQLLKATNALISDLNRYNAELTSHINLGEINGTIIDSDNKLELLALRASRAVYENRLKLNEERFKYMAKYKKFITENPEVRDLVLDDVHITDNFKLFVEQKDKLVVDAEVEMLRLDEQAKKDPTKQAENSDRISQLREFIITQNSLVSRALVIESTKQHLDIPTYLADRNRRKAEMVQERMKALRAEEPTIPQPRDRMRDAAAMRFRQEIKAAISEILAKELEAVREQPTETATIDFGSRKEIIDIVNKPEYASVSEESKREVLTKQIEAAKALYQAQYHEDRLDVVSAVASELKHAFESRTEVPKEEEIQQFIAAVMVKYKIQKDIRITYNQESSSFELFYSTHEAEKKRGNIGVVKPVPRTISIPVLTKEKEQPKINVRPARLNLRYKDPVQARVNRVHATLLAQQKPIVVQAIKNGVRIMLSEQFKKHLIEQGAKLALVNKENYRVRTSAEITDEEGPIDIAFREDHEIDPSKYKIEFRVKKGDGTNETVNAGTLDLEEHSKKR